MNIGTVTSTPGAVESGWLDVATLPTGTAERLPVLVAEGHDDGPVLWVTAGLHGDEVTGIAAAQDVVTDELAGRLRGTLVCLPVCNPAGVRRGVRRSYYHNDDPNRSFPATEEVDRSRPPRLQERINRRVFTHLEATADALVSLHSGWVHERAFTIVERVRYGGDRDRAEGERLAAEVAGLAAAFGLPPVREFDPATQEGHGLQRSLENAAIDVAGVPAITPELGSPRVVDERTREAAVAGVRNAMRWLGMLPGDPEPIEAVPDAPVAYPVKRVDGPFASTGGLVRHHVDAGDVVGVGDPVADVVSPHGEVRATVTSAHDGYVLGRREGIAVYENDALVSLAARDGGDLLVERE